MKFSIIFTNVVLFASFVGLTHGDPLLCSNVSSDKTSSLFSDENGGASDYTHGPISRVSCYGGRCDDKRLKYKHLPASDIDTSKGSWTGYFSDENSKRLCPKDKFVVRMQCKGDMCDDIRFKCVPFSSDGFYEFKTDKDYDSTTRSFSDEGTNYGDCGIDGAVVGVECVTGEDKCDTLKLYCRKWGMKQGPGIKCNDDSNPNAIYQVSYQEDEAILRHYPNPAVFKSWDPQENYCTANCQGVSHGPPMNYNDGGTSCAREEYLPAVNELREGIDMCNTHQNTYLFVDDCELHYMNVGTGVQTKIAGKYDHDCQLIMQRDGNIVFYDHMFGSSIWKSSTRGRNGQMYIDPHGVVYLQIPIIRLRLPSTNHSGGGWYPPSRNCKGSKLFPWQQLGKNEYICDEDSEAYFGINTDGNLVGASCDGCFEENPTHEDYNAHHVKMETSGNLILYDNNSNVLWEAETEAAGQSKCPHESGTAAIEDPSFEISAYPSQYVFPDEDMVFEIEMRNVGVGDESQFVFYAQHRDNSESLGLFLDGAPFPGSREFTNILKDTVYKKTLVVRRGPQSYEYPPLDLILESACEDENSR